MSERCPTCGQRKKRSLPQNARLHKIFTEIAANLTASDGLYHSAQWWKVMSKDRWLGYEDYRNAKGDSVMVLRSTADCDVEELNNFMAKVEEYAIGRGIWLDGV